MELELSLVHTISDLPSGLWSELEGPESYPFLRYEWLSAFEQSGTLGPKQGWVPRHIVVRRVGRGPSAVLAVAPAYVKLHSMGEFVFDHAWAELSEVQLGVRYYPKLVLCVPFTPATGPRVLFRSGLTEGERAAIFDLVTSALPQLVDKLGLSSVHALFPDQAQGEDLHERGWAERLGLQFQFHRDACATFDDYLRAFKSKRRTQVRRERKAMDQQRIAIDCRSGPELSTDDARLAYRIYLTTVDKYVWGRRYLNQAFFESVFDQMPEALHFVRAKDEAGTVVGGALNLLGRHALYGRYWGCLQEVPFLHFNVCLYVGIEETLRRGLARFEPGAGGEHKEGRGFRATLTRSFHFLADERLDGIVRDFLLREAEAVRARAAEDGGYGSF